MKEREALKLALEALERINRDAVSREHTQLISEEPIAAIKEALAQPEQEPYGYLKLSTAKFFHEVEGCNPKTDKKYLALYATPPQRKPLTDEQIEMLQFLDGSRPLDGVWFGEEHPKQQGEYWWRKHLHRAFDEAAHGIKENT